MTKELTSHKAIKHVIAKRFLGNINLLEASNTVIKGFITNDPILNEMVQDQYRILKILVNEHKLPYILANTIADYVALSVGATLDKKEQGQLLVLSINHVDWVKLVKNLIKEEFFN